MRRSSGNAFTQSSERDGLISWTFSILSRTTMLLIAALTLITTVWGQANQGVRLAESPLGKHAGRVEVKYYGRWGTICNSRWDYGDGKVICSMLNFPDAVCAVTSGTHVFGEGTGHVWLTDLGCYYGSLTLNDCTNNVPKSTNPCSHSQDAAVICQDYSIMPLAYNITQIKRTTRTVSISWMLPSIPPYVSRIRFQLYVFLLGSLAPPNIQYYYTDVTESSRHFNFTIRQLTVNTTYGVKIEANGLYHSCYTYILGNKSESINITTASEVPPSTLPIRLLTSRTDRPYIGRLEVYHDGQWGTVCNNYFGWDDATLACMELNYTRGSICYGIYNFPVSTGPIWLDRLDCYHMDRFEDCTHSGWGVVSDYCSSSYTIGLICDPGPSEGPVVTGLKATKVTHTSITLEWDNTIDVGLYRVHVLPRNFYYDVYMAHQFTVGGLELGVNYSISISGAVWLGMHGYGGCYDPVLYGEYTEPITVETYETAPDVSVTAFHIDILNSTTVEVTWRLPYSGVNGIVRGFKIYVDKTNGSESVIDVKGDMVQAYIITDLEQSAKYLFSMLIYTVADGPRGIYLPVIMPDSDFIPLIAVFGVNGNGLEVVSYSMYMRGINVLCGSHVQDTVVFWQFTNGSRIGVSNPGFRAGHYENGTAVLQIGTALPFTRYLTVCDGGQYTCVATSPEGGVLTRNFSLQYGYYPPAVNKPKLISKGPTWVQIGWEPLDCDGGHNVNRYTVQYAESTLYEYDYDYDYDYLFPYYVYNYRSAAIGVSGYTYTIHNLNPSTEYRFRVLSISSVTSATTRSYFYLTVTTHRTGPSPPRGLTVKVTSNLEVCARWKPPATPNGVVTLYKLYAEIIGSSADITEAIDLPTDTVVKTFPGSVLSGCMEMSHSEVIYHFQMSAVSVNQGELVEGTLSAIDTLTTVYVPKPGIPQPVRIQATPSNTSVALQWELPGHDEQTYLYFNVSYSGVVEWMSNEENFISFKEQGQATTDNTSLVIYPLTPSTEYVFKVAVVTSEGQGAEAVVDVTTGKEAGDKLAYFQIHIININDCEEWHNEETEQKLDDIRKSLVSILNVQCTCDITTSHISQGEFSCRSDPNDSIVYRARISGTPTVSASDLATLIHNWAQDGSASIKVGSSRFQLDPTCNATLDNIHAPDCTVETEKVTEKPTKQVTEKNNESNEGFSSGQTTGIMAVGIITGVLQLVVFIVLIVIIVLWIKQKKSKPLKNQAFRELVNVPSHASVGEDEGTVKL